MALSLVGKLWTIRSFNVNAIISTVKMVWNVKKGLEINELGQILFIFRFTSKKDKQFVINSEP